MHVVYTMQMSLIMIWLFRCVCESALLLWSIPSKPVSLKQERVCYFFEHILNFLTDYSFDLNLFLLLFCSNQENVIYS